MPKRPSTRFSWTRALVTGVVLDALFPLMYLVGDRIAGTSEGSFFAPLSEFNWYVLPAVLPIWLLAGIAQEGVRVWAARSDARNASQSKSVE